MAAPEKSGGMVHEAGDFSLVLGGPLYQLFRQAHLSGDALELAARRVIVIALVAWLPLLVLTAAEGRVLAGVAVPFLLDLEVHVRFLVVIPFLVAAELVVHRRMRFVVSQFRDRGVIPEASRSRFEDIVSSAFRLRNSLAAELLLVVLVYGVGVSLIWRHYMALPAATWYATPSADGSELTPSGFWFGYVSLPLFQFLLVRWYFRLFIWARFLWQVSRIELSLIPTHPDRLGGLGFLPGTAYAFIPLAVAHGAMVAGLIANRIFYTGATLLSFKVEIGVIVGFMLLLLFGPLLVFSPQLAAAKRTGAREYGTLAERYVREFDVKWLRGEADTGEPLVGSADIQSLADLSNSYEVVQTMRVIPVTRDAAIQLAAATLAPMVPLALTMMPAEELLKRLFQILI